MKQNPWQFVHNKAKRVRKRSFCIKVINNNSLSEAQKYTEVIKTYQTCKKAEIKQAQAQYASSMEDAIMYEMNLPLIFKPFVRHAVKSGINKSLRGEY